eukprot:CAMPEP_0184014758 /NCGR_PEP_ID=MMETSP0954-20121128/5884_1 /TAXON_ID=627963 /ORGANISM="Aplanochytrium sp, Strain PBS07" /LENGTH=117 /DNA_ID=CAMNT_0026295369 /DNA_START=235 /DNA_END=588 /DNA_ORIENTATION=-
MMRPWVPVLTITGFEKKQHALTITGFEKKQHALQFEWALKHYNKRGKKRKQTGVNGLPGRLISLSGVLESERSTSKAPKTKDLRLSIEWHDKDAETKFNELNLNTPSVQKTLNVLGE